MSDIKYPQPLEDRYILLPDETTDEGINKFLPEELKQKPKTGVVKAVGLGKQAIENGVILAMQARVGDRVKYGRFKGDEIEIEGVKHIIIKQEDLLVIL